MTDPGSGRSGMSDLVAGVVATAALGTTFLALHMPILVAAGVAVAVYGGTKLLFTDPFRRLAGGRPDEPDTRAVIECGRKQMAELRAAGDAVAKESVRNSIYGICHSAGEIMAMFERDPAKVPLARGFVEFTLGRSLKIVQKYRELSSLGRSAAIQQSLSRVEALLGTIDSSFRQQIERLLLNDAADLDAEVEILKTRLDIESEGDPL